MFNDKQETNLDENLLRLSEIEYDARKKDSGTTWIIFRFLGFLGIHRFYLGYKFNGYIRLSVFLSFIAMSLIMDKISIVTSLNKFLEIIWIVHIVSIFILYLFDWITFEKILSVSNNRLKEEIHNDFINQSGNKTVEVRIR